MLCVYVITGEAAFQTYVACRHLSDNVYNIYGLLIEMTMKSMQQYTSQIHHKTISIDY